MPWELAKWFDSVNYLKMQFRCEHMCFVRDWKCVVIDLNASFQRQ